ncbi:unnamed protein product [Closterium sp. NIES-64]|nr:unnamed protein product [Closterium sp. NIES-64]
MRYTAASIAASGGSGAAEALADKAVGGGGGGGYGEHGPVVGAAHSTSTHSTPSALSPFPLQFLLFSSHPCPLRSSFPSLPRPPSRFLPPPPFRPLSLRPLSLRPSSFRPPCPPPLFLPPPLPSAPLPFAAQPSARGPPRMPWLPGPSAASTLLHSAEGLNAHHELEASIREHHPHLRDEEVDLIVDGRLPCMVRERTAEQAPASGQQGGTGEGGAVHEAPSAVGVGGGALAPTIDTEIIGASYGQFKFGVEHISIQLAQLRKGDDETAESYCNRARTIRAELLTIGKEVHMATFAAHVLKGLPPEYGFLCRKLEFSSPDMTVERVCSEVLMEEQTLSIEQSYKQITSDASAFLGAVNAIVATTGVNGKEGKGGREQTDKKKDGKWEKK